MCAKSFLTWEFAEVSNKMVCNEKEINRDECTFHENVDLNESEVIDMKKSPSVMPL